MKKVMYSLCAASMLFLASCADGNKTDTTESKSDTSKTTTADVAKADPAQLKTDIVAVETAWADALNKKDLPALMAMYADNATSMPDGEPTATGKAEIQKLQEKDFATKKPGSISFETLEVYGQGDIVTEVGKSMVKDTTGKLLSSGKYIAVFEKSNGKYLCIREIYNKDSK